MDQVQCGTTVQYAEYVEGTEPDYGVGINYPSEPVQREGAPVAKFAHVARNFSGREGGKRLGALVRPNVARLPRFAAPVISPPDPSMSKGAHFLTPSQAAVRADCRVAPARYESFNSRYCALNDSRSSRVVVPETEEDCLEERQGQGDNGSSWGGASGIQEDQRPSAVIFETHNSDAVRAKERREQRGQSRVAKLVCEEESSGKDEPEDLSARPPSRRGRPKGSRNRRTLGAGASTEKKNTRRRKGYTPEEVLVLAKENVEGGGGVRRVEGRW